MARVEVVLNGRSYAVACDDGQEEHVYAMGEYVENKITTLRAQAKTASDAQLLVMASLILADELFEARQESSSQNGAPTPKNSHDLQEREAMDEALHTLSNRLENIAENIENITNITKADWSEAT